MGIKNKEKPSYWLNVINPKDFTATLMDFFSNKECLLEIGSYDFDKKYKDKFKKFETMIYSQIWLFRWPKKCYQINNAMISIFINDFLNNIDVKKSIWKLLIYQGNSAIVECYDSFSSVYSEEELPKELIEKLIHNIYMTPNVKR